MKKRLFLTLLTIVLLGTILLLSLLLASSVGNTEAPDSAKETSENEKTDSSSSYSENTTPLTDIPTSSLESPPSSVDLNFSTASFGAREAIVRQTNLKEITYPLRLISSAAYDYVTLHINVGENLVLCTEKTVTFTGNIENFDLSFTVKNLLSTLPLDYRDTKFDRIIVRAEFFREEKKIQTAETTVKVLPTSAGVFASLIGSRELFEEYANALKEDGLITLNEYANAVRSCHELPPASFS